MEISCTRLKSSESRVPVSLRSPTLCFSAEEKLTGQDVGVSVLGPVDGQVRSIVTQVQADRLQLLERVKPSAQTRDARVQHPRTNTQDGPTSNCSENL